MTKYIYAAPRPGKFYSPGDEVDEDYAKAHPDLVRVVDDDTDNDERGAKGGDD